MEGKIKTLTDRDYGFIKVEGQPDVFFFKDSLAGVQFSELQLGEAVTFDLEDSPKGPRAANVQRAA